MAATIAAIVVLPSPCAAAAVGTTRVLMLRGDQTSAGPIQFFGDPSVLAPQGDVLVRASAGESGAPEVTAVLLGGSARPLATLAAGGDSVGGAPIQSFDNLIAGARGWSRFSTASGPGIAASDVPATAFAVVAGVGADAPNADLFPRQFAVGGEWLAILEGEAGRTELVKLTTIAPFADPPRRVDVLQVDDEIGGLPITAFVSDSLTLNSSGAGMVTLTRNGLDQAVVKFDAGTGAILPVLAVGDPAPGFAPGIDVLNIRSAPRLNAAGAYAVKARLFGAGLGTPEVIYLFGADGGLIGVVQEGAAIPGAGPTATFTQLGSPIIGVTGTVFLYRRMLADDSSVPALGMLDLAGGFRSLGVAGEGAPGGGTFIRFDSFIAMAPDGLLVFRAQTQTGTSYFGLDTTDADAVPYRIIGPGDQVMLPSGPAAVSTVGTIGAAGGQDGLGTSLNETQLVVTAGLQGGHITVLLVNVVDVSEGGDVNCDGAITAADLPALAQSIVTGDRVPCRFDDVNGDGRVDGDDLDALVTSIFD